jgi:hypothetical protein
LHLRPKGEEGQERRIIGRSLFYEFMTRVADRGGRLTGI